MKKRKYQKRIIIKRVCKHDCYKIRSNPEFTKLFAELVVCMSHIAQKKGFNKKEFSHAFGRFNDVLGAYPFRGKDTTRYMTKVAANV